MYESVFGKSHPIASPLDSSKLIHLRSTIPMRSFNKAMGPRASLAATGSGPGPAAMNVNGMMQFVQVLLRNGLLGSAQFLRPATDGTTEIPIQMLGKIPSKSPHRALPPVQTAAARQLALPDVEVDGNNESVAEEKPGKDWEEEKPTMNATSATVDKTTDMLVAALASRNKASDVERKRPASEMLQKPTNKLELPVTTAGHGKPKGCISVERNRMQVLARTGLKGKGQSKAFKYEGERTTSSTRRRMLQCGCKLAG
jgi:hypothetical protein